jgi:hypothetical protein
MQMRKWANENTAVVNKKSMRRQENSCNQKNQCNLKN